MTAGTPTISNVGYVGVHRLTPTYSPALSEQVQHKADAVGLRQIGAAGMDHKKRFAGWRRRMPRKTTQYLVDQVVARIVPEFERRGFVWYPDFAGNNLQEIGANEIPLQRREGAEWPTVQITFLKGVWGPRFSIAFSALPEVCKNPIRSAIPRERAIVVYGPACFDLCRGVWKDFRDSVFGFDWMSALLPTPRQILRLIRYLFNWRKFLDSEVDTALALLPVLFDIFDQGIPQEWINHDFGRITSNVMLIHSWRLWDKRRPGETIPLSK